MQKKAKHKTNKKQNNYNKEEGYLVVVINKKSKRLTMHPVQVRYLYRTGYYQV